MDNIIASLTYVLKRESNVTVDQLRESESYINYPQWLASLNIFGWKNSLSLGSEDRAALFPLNITLLRLNGIMRYRKSYFITSLAMAKEVRRRLDLPTNFELQLASFITSNIYVNWTKLSDKEKAERYNLLWVNFKGSLWKELEKSKEDE